MFNNKSQVIANKRKVGEHKINVIMIKSRPKINELEKDAVNMNTGCIQQIEH